MDFNKLKKYALPITFKAFVLLMWVTAFLYLLYDANYTLFLKPEFVFLIYMGLFISILFLLSLFFTKTLSTSKSDYLNGFIILLPLFFIFYTGQQTLNSYALSKRTLMPIIPIEDEAPNKNLSNEISLLKLVTAWKTYQGKKVTIQGLFNESIQEIENYSMVFRYLVTCCAADSVPVGIFMEKEKLQNYKNNDWVKVTGVVKPGKINDFDVIIMSLEKIEKVEKPSKNAAYMFF